MRARRRTGWRASERRRETSPGRGAAGRHRACGVMEARGKRKNKAHPNWQARRAGSADDDPRWRQPEATHGPLDRRRRMGPAAPELRHRCACCIMVRSTARSTAYKSAARPSRLARRARLGNLSSAFGPTGTAHPTRQSRPPVLVTVKDKSLRDGPAATLDRHCARRPVGRWSPMGRTRR